MSLKSVLLHCLRFAALTAVICSALAPAAARASTPVRQRILMDAGWRFHLASTPVLKNPVPISSWRWKADDQGPTDAATLAAPTLDTSGAGWQSAHTGDDVFQGRVGYAWFRTSLPSIPGPHRELQFQGVDDNATVYLNGRRLAYHAGWNDPFDVTLDPAWRPAGPNALAVLVQNTAGQGGIIGSVTLGGEPITVGGDPSQPGFRDGSWRVVHLPHDYVVEQKFTPTANAGHGSLPTPLAWYRKTFTLPASDRGKTLWIDFDGIYRDAIVYLNGKELGEHQSGYTSFRYNITGVAHYGGKNVLAVHVDPRHFEGWWYEGGGIYRHVWLNVTEPLHVAPWGTYVTTSLPEPKPGGAVAPAVVAIQTTLTNDAARSYGGRLNSVVYDDQNRVAGKASTAMTIPRYHSQTVTQKVTVFHPRLWSLQTPRMYHVVQTVERGGRTVDDESTPFGIRTIRFDPNTGFYLNGKSVKIYGTCNHQDFAGVGIAVPDTLEAWRVEKLKEMGANAWRMSHNPPTPSLLDACDRLGMLVMDENRHLGDTYSDHTPSGTPYSNLSDLASMIKRDRNHPSIIIWSMCNEEGLEGSPEGARIFAAMMKVVHKYDRTRPISCAMNGGWFNPGFRTVEDLMGVNYNSQVYDRFHQLYPNMPMFGSETASTLTTRGVYANNRQKAWVTSYNMTDGSWAPIATRPFMAGSFPWTGFDYKGEPTPFGWPDINSNFGIMDMCGFPKDNYYYYQSWWKTKPIVHLMPHWNWPGQNGQPIRVIAFSNCERVELFLNGKSQGAKTMPRNGHLEWTVDYAPGTLMARGYNNGKLAATDIVQTTGAPAALRLKTGRTVLAADGEDLIPVEVDVLDSKGRIVPTADNHVTFSVTGAGHVAGVGNGNPSDHDPDKASYRNAFNGKCMVIVGAGEKPGAILLRASSPGLKGMTMRFQAR
ncbi:MAG TPA: beta-galactosidase GalA [Armatimonadota bacterium]|nr:beta-galactosidase GalA [Armatimonadota bacterium]